MSTRYKPDDRGLAELGRSAAMGAAAREGAAAVRRVAEADNPRGAYDTVARTVPSGWRNEPRAGAAVVETRTAAGARKRTLARAASTGRTPR